jgi:response regulator RpfG family c-di-GMP phosphodiesterase
MTTTRHVSRGWQSQDRIQNNKLARVLCIDDDPDISRGLQLWLNQYEVEVLHAHYGMQGVALAASCLPNAIITDIRMPQGDGDHVVACLRRRAETWDIPMIVLTGQKDTELERRMRHLGVRHYLQKPATWHDLESALFETLKLPKVEDAHLEVRPHLFGA